MWLKRFYVFVWKPDLCGVKKSVKTVSVTVEPVKLFIVLSVHLSLTHFFVFFLLFNLLSVCNNSFNFHYAPATLKFDLDLTYSLQQGSKLDSHQQSSLSRATSTPSPPVISIHILFKQELCVFKCLCVYVKRERVKRELCLQCWDTRTSLHLLVLLVYWSPIGSNTPEGYLLIQNVFKNVHILWYFPGGND